MSYTITGITRNDDSWFADVDEYSGSASLFAGRWDDRGQASQFGRFEFGPDDADDVLGRAHEAAGSWFGTGGP